MAALSSLPALNMDSSYGVDKLTYEIFSILENKFLFGYGDPNSKISNPEKPHNLISSTNGGGGGSSNGKVRILSIDGGGATDGILAADSLSRLEASLREKSGNPNAAIADYFDVVAGSGAGGVLAAMLFTRGRDGGPLFTAEAALKFMAKNRRKIFRSSPAGFFRRVLMPAAGRAETLFGKVFGELSLRDTLKSVLIPCYDLATGAPFLFSRADAFEMDGYDFKMRDVCAATSADPTTGGAFEMRSVDQRTKILAVDGGIAMNNPTAAAITHVLNNKQEFPLCNGVQDLLVVSLGNGESEFGAGDVTSSPATARLLRIAGEGASDLVDQSVSMAFGECRASNYIRIQGNGIIAKNYGGSEKTKMSNKKMDMLRETEKMLSQKNVESVLFQGKRIYGSSNIEKIDLFASELFKEQERRKTSILPMVALKQMSPSPRTSSATTLSSLSSN